MKSKSAAMLAIIGTILVLVVQLIYCIKYLRTFYNYTIHFIPVYVFILFQALGFVFILIYFISVYRQQGKSEINIHFLLTSASSSNCCAIFILKK